MAVWLCVGIVRGGILGGGIVGGWYCAVYGMGLLLDRYIVQTQLELLFWIVT